MFDIMKRAFAADAAAMRLERIAVAEAVMEQLPANVNAHYSVNVPYRIADGTSTPRPSRSSARIVTRFLVKSSLT